MSILKHEYNRYAARRELLTKTPIAAILIGSLFLVAPPFGASRDPGFLHGTILIFWADSERVIVGADSKVSGPQFSDVRARKIIKLSDHDLFAYSGGAAGFILPSGQIAFRATDLAHSAFEQLRSQPRSNERIIAVASRWGELVKKNLDPLLVLVKKNSLPGYIGLGGFAGLDGAGNPSLYYVRIDVTTPDRGPPFVTPEKPTKWPIDPTEPYLSSEGGAYGGFNEFLAAMTPRAQSANAKFGRSLTNKPRDDWEAYRLAFGIETALSWYKSYSGVGGAVDVAVLERGHKVRWIQRKQRCYSRENCCD
jgi:hypothetical protein